MAIRINAGAVPPAGRLTMPKGTFLPNLPPLSNPSTSAIGTISGAAGMNPAIPQVPDAGTPVGGNPFLPGGEAYATDQQARSQSIGGLIQSIDQQMKDDHRKMLENAKNYNYEEAEQRFGSTVAKFGQWYSNLVVGLGTPQQPTSALAPPKNPLVGEDLGALPTYIPNHALMQMFGGLPPEQRSEMMRAKGYERSYQAGVGEVWVKVGEGTGQTVNMNSAVDSRGRPEYVDPTSLERGERVTAASGITFVGGEDYTDSGGNTVSQYAMTIPGGANDKKGRYKWKSRVQKDANGNWVRIYSKELRKVHTRSHRRKVMQRQEEINTAKQKQQVNSADLNQLVTFRADYG